MQQLNFSLFTIAAVVCMLGHKYCDTTGSVMCLFALLGLAIHYAADSIPRWLK